MARFRLRRSRDSAPPRRRAASWAGALVAFVIITFGAMYSSCDSVSRTPATTGTPAPPVAAGAQNASSGAQKIRTDVGFASRRKLVEHYEKHGREFGSVSADEYLRRAQELRDRAGGGDVLEAKRADGVVTRFDRRTGAFLAFNSDLTIRTFFKPNAGEAYFRRQARR
jgi:pyocin large subunit-like protein